MKICLLCNEYPPGGHGGIGTFTQVLARALVGAGHHVRVVGVYPRDDNALEYAEDQGVQVYRLRRPLSRGRWLAARHALYRTVRNWCLQGMIELVEAPDYQGWIAGWPRLPVPVVVRLHGSSSYFAAEMGDSVSRLTFWLERKALLRADDWCSVSRYTAERTRTLFRLPSEATAILYNPVELEDAAAAPLRSRDDVVFTGTLTPKKGIVSLVRSWPMVLQRCPRAQLHIYGKDGRAENGVSMQENLRQLLADHERATVHFHGHQPRAMIRSALGTARLAVFPSYAEAFAIAPLEAMSSGCPTIYSERGSGRELIEHGEHGLLVDPDNLTGLADSMIRLLTDDALSQRIGQAGQERIRRRFSLPCVLQENEAFYQQCIVCYRASRNAPHRHSAPSVDGAAAPMESETLRIDCHDEQFTATHD